MRTVLLALASVGVSHAASPWDPKYRAQAEATLALMTSDQKFTMVHGTGGGYVGDVPAITLSNGVVIPPINLEDGPQGVADGVSRVTAWPSALTVVQSWDTEAMYAYGYAMGQEQWRKGTNVMLGPGVNLARVPWCGACPLRPSRRLAAASARPHPRAPLPRPFRPQGATLSTRARTRTSPA